MSRTLSKLFTKLNVVIFAVNFAVLFVAMMMLFSVTNNMDIYMIPGIFFCGIICLVYPDFFNMVAGAFGMQEVTSPTPTVAFEHIKQIIDNAFTRDYSFLKQNGIPVATFCVVVCWILGIVCLFQQQGLLKVVNSPMDWYKRKFLSTYVYGVFGGAYGAFMCVGACSVVFAKEPLTGGLMTLAWYFLLCGLAIVAGVVILIVERLISVQLFDALTIDEQTALCEKQAKYMDKRQRRRQVRRLGDSARTDNQLEKRNKKKGKNGKKSNNVKKPDVVKPAPQPKVDKPIEIITDDLFTPTDDKK